MNENLKEQFIVDFSDKISVMLQNMMKMVQLSNGLPQRDEMVYLKNTPIINDKIKKLNGQIAQNILKINKYCNSRTNLTGKVIKYQSIIETNDVLCENVDLMLDKAKNVNQKNPFIINQQNTLNQISHKSDYKPQTAFLQAIDNSEAPFKPMLTQKYFAIQELKFDEHPYKEEIQNFTKNIQININIEIQESSRFSSQNFFFIDTKESLLDMIQQLENQKEISIDLEHHNFRSYQGFLCLFQISTRDKDFIIDPFPIWDQIKLMQPLFANPNIIKVMHGANSDVQWLQRDFGIYIVGLFDTGQAARFLNLESFSLAFLLMKYCNKQADKQYQTSDWRVRPLSQEQIKYAREDTHYLLNIYDKLQQEIVKKNIDDAQKNLKHVWEKSAEVALISYQKPELKNDNYYQILNRQKQIMTKKNLQIFKKIMKLRDQISRNEDESPAYVLPYHILFHIIDRQPQNESQLMEFKKLSQCMKKYSNELLQLFQNEEIESQKIEVENVRKYEFPEMKWEFDLSQVKLFQFQEVDVQIQKYKSLNYLGSKFQDQPDNLKQINCSFNYPTHTEFFCSLYPELSDYFKDIKQESEQENPQVSMQKNFDKILIEDSSNDFISLPKEKKEKPCSPKNKRKIVDLDIPDSIQQQFDASLGKKRKNRKKIQKSSQNKNQFELFEQDDEYIDDEEIIQMMDKKIQETLNKQSSNIALINPLEMHLKGKDMKQKILLKKENQQKKKQTKFGSYNQNAFM